MMMLNLPARLIQIGPVAVRALTPGVAAVMPAVIRSKRGVDDADAKELLPEVRSVADRFPGDSVVLSALAEAEHDAGNDREAIVAADAALAIDPSQVNAYVQKGLSLFRIAQDAPDKDAAYRAVRATFTALNHLEPNHPLPLFYYYESFLRQGKAPAPLALQGLERASELAPFDLGLRMTLAMQQLRFGKREEARRNLGPVAYNPHGGKLAETAHIALERMDGEPDWNGSGLEVSADGQAE